MKKQVLTAIGILAITGSVQTAAASSHAEAYIDWDSLSFQLVDFSGGASVPTLTWTTKTGSVSTSATTVDPSDNGSGSQSRNNFTTNLFSEVETDFAQAYATRNQYGLAAEASSQPGVTPVSGLNNASASVSNNGNFQLTGNGLLLISLDWSVYSSGSTGDIFNGFNNSEWASASVAISSSYSGQFTSGNASTSYTTAPNYWWISGEESQSSTFVLAIFNTGLETISGSISAVASASAFSSAFNNAPIEPVPLPTSAWLFGSALFGLLVQRRRKVA